MLLTGRFRYLFFTVFSFVSISGYAQERCGTVEYTKKLQQKGLISTNDQQFEDWLQRKIQLENSTRKLRKESGTYKIPVVVHIIHNGETEGSGTNISTAQVLSQISVLNKDFRRLNADATNTPAEFQPVAAGMDIEFVLAKQTPEGLASSGIVRVQGTKTQWSVNDNYELKSLSYWPAEDYLNIWVCNITDFLGYTQFPESPLQGLENSSTNRLTDGVVIWYRAFGSVDDGAFNLDTDYNKGRTTTHEVAHFFGLRHIWGDDGGSCNGTDYVADTPNQGGSTSGCPSQPKVTCSVDAMFQNFLDYTDDRCMNLFTQGQIARMSTVIENSPRRVSLLTSHGLSDPMPVPNDLGIKEVLSPASNECSNTITPRIEIKNYGSNAVSSARIRLTIDGVVKETKDLTLTLGQLQSTEVTFNPQSLASGTHTISFAIILTNGVTDGATQNNTSSFSFFIPQTDTVPFSENFNSLPPKWQIQNPDQQITWQIATAPKDTQSNKALYLNFYDYEDSFGELDVLVSPVYDLSTVPLASIVFDVAYSRFQGSNDRLKVVVMRDCESVLDGLVVFDKAGAALATAPSTGQAFIPSGESSWRRELINISQFIGETHVQFAFVGVNDWGNNLYLDNISLLTSELEDLLLKNVVSPSLVTCDDHPIPKITVQNLGTVTVNSFDVEYSINGGATQIFHVQGIGLVSNSEKEIDLPALTLNEGVNTFFVNITKPNNKADETPANNQQEFIVAVNKASDRIPYRENFDKPFEQEWTAINPESGMDWQATTTNFKTSIYFNSANNTNIGDEAWLVSPVLDFSRATTASLVFDVSQKAMSGRKDELKILVSEDCGNTYAELNTTFTADEFPSAWAPKLESDWRKNVIVDLSQFAGKAQVRVAFVVTNGNGNNVFVDNVEFFTTNTPDTLEITEIFSVYGYSQEGNADNLRITFNLPELQPVRYSVIDVMGRTYADGILPDILNQTYPIALEEHLGPGMYIVRLKIADRYYSTKVLINK